MTDVHEDCKIIVAAIFKEKDAEIARLTERVKELLLERDNLSSDYERSSSLLVEERGRIERAMNLVHEAMETYSNLEDEHPYFVDVFDTLMQILIGAR